MVGGWRTLGLHVEEDYVIKQAIVKGCGGLFPVGKDGAKEEVELFLGNAGTAMRPLTAAVTATCELVMTAPLALGDVEIEIIDKLISIPYVEMTLKLMKRFRVNVEHNDSWDRFFVNGGQKYMTSGNAYVEGDASSASYFLAGAAITGGIITVEGLWYK